MKDLFAKEGRAIQELFTRTKGTTVQQLLSTFSLEDLMAKLQEKAPNILSALAEISNQPERKKDPCRNENLVFAAICAMVAILCSQKANNFQAVISLFLIGSGAAKREMEVFAHAGLCLSYTSAIAHLRNLSQEATKTYREAIQSSFCIALQRLESKDHFDNGCTTTLIQTWDPLTKSTHVPHDDQVLPSPKNIQELTECSIWQLKQIALEVVDGLKHLRSSFGTCPQVDQIDLHVTKQWLLPAMHEEESSIEETIRVYKIILRNLGVTDDFLKKHGLLFNDGDLLTDSLVEAARRNSEAPIEGMKAAIHQFGIFHAKMAGAGLVINEHWGKPNSKHPGAGLWWENNYLNRKNSVADGFRVFCGHDNLDEWADRATKEEFDRVAEDIYKNLFSTWAYEELKKKPYHDTTLENTILYN
ncbi:hypothetical protein BDP27DRAFT_1367142 [Rhodocollybia butyracea]|uniref:DUF6589 domain-containing protein n=1 Tax=Rhodocollybia butyracea TaxID=206335 RepID=A0A9P5PFT8_9AGAR|nr:hypothetical protein BDP27DRAFT_1367142 [Rhodocollybia butyracea]